MPDLPISQTARRQRGALLWRMALPLLLILVGVFGLVGCIILPIPEHQTNRDQKDFRSLVGTEEKPGPIHVGISKGQVVALLGTTPYVSKDGRTMVYFVDFERGLIIALLCSSPQGRYFNALVLTFDEHTILSKLESRMIGAASAAFSPPEPLEWARWRFLGDMPGLESFDEMRQYRTSQPATQP